jgi:hypothetical protein
MPAGQAQKNLYIGKKSGKDRYNILENGLIHSTGIVCGGVIKYGRTAESRKGQKEKQKARRRDFRHIREA